MTERAAIAGVGYFLVALVVVAIIIDRGRLPRTERPYT